MSFGWFVSALMLLFGLYPTLSQTSDTTPLRFGVLSIAQPARIYAQWTPFAQHFEQQVGRPVVIIIPKGFKKMKQAVIDKQVDFFYVNSYVFYRLKQEGQAVAIAQMQNIKESIVSQSEIFVRSDSGIEIVEELKGKNFAFVSPMGAGGYLAPRAYLYGKGINSAEEINESFTKNLSTSLHKVLLRQKDAGAMCGLNYELMKKKVDTGELKIIGITGDYPENVLAARNDLDPALIQRLTEIVVNMSHSVAGKQILGAMRDMKIQAFVPYQDNIEQITRSLIEQAHLQP